MHLESGSGARNLLSAQSVSKRAHGAEACEHSRSKAIEAVGGHRRRGHRARGQHLDSAVGESQRNQNPEQQHRGEQNNGQRDRGGPAESGTVELTRSGGAIGHRTLLLYDRILRDRARALALLWIKAAVRH